MLAVTVRTAGGLICRAFHWVITPDSAADAGRRQAGKNGQVQSRDYIKVVEGESTERTAYNLSVAVTLWSNCLAHSAVSGFNNRKAIITISVRSCPVEK
jgi:hypothetical protein